MWLVLLAAYAATLGIDARPGERYSARESHALLTADSIVSDGDLDLRNQYAERAWGKWSGPPIRPSAGLTAGRLVEPQGVGFPLLIAPAYAIGGPVAVQLWLAAILAAGFVVAASLGRRLVPEPWPTATALVAGLSPPALIAATSISPEGAGATAIAVAALAALTVRDKPRVPVAIGGAAAVAIAPWLAVELAGAAAVCALALARWLRRRSRPLTAFVALEVVFLSAVLFVTIDDRLFGGLTPYAASRTSPIGADTVGDVAARLPRLAGLWIGRDAGLLLWAPLGALAFYALWLGWRSRRDRLSIAVAAQADVEVAGGFLAAVCGAQVLVATFLAPALAGPWGPARLLVPVLPAGAALAAWGLRFAPRIGTVLAVATLALSAWLLAGPRLGEGTRAPVRGDVPWSGAEHVLPRLGAEVRRHTPCRAVACATTVRARCQVDRPSSS